MADALIDVPAVRAALGPAAGTSLPEEFLQSLIERATARLRARVARLDERVASGQLDATFVRTVLADAIVVVARNPAGYTAHSVGDVSRSWSAGGGGGPRLEFDEADLLLLRPPGTGGIRSATLGVPSWRT